VIRYCKQRDNYSCGPVAILNVIKWTDSNWFTYSMLPAIQSVCKTDKNGTYDNNFNNALKYFEQIDYFKVVKARNTHLTRIQEHLENGGTMIAAYKENGYKCEWHYAMFLFDTHSQWTVINHSNGKELFTRHQVSRSLMHKRLDKSAIWLINKH
jgi:hypothetical protein